MYDLIVVGAGWAGFNAALQAKSLGLNVALLEENLTGGTCLNSGCIPTKTLVQSVKILEEARSARIFGIEIKEQPQADFSAIQARKERIIQQLRQAMESRLAGIEYKKGRVEILDSQRVKTEDKIIQAKNILLATGSRAAELPAFPFDGKKIISSDQILNLGTVPGSLLIIGGGVIGCEFAQVFSSLGSKVTVVEIMPQLLPGIDIEISRRLETVFKKNKITVKTNVDARTIDLNGFELVLVSVGRRPRVEGLEGPGIEIIKSGIQVDDYLRTSVPNIYAAGDCTGKLMLAHFASYQGIIAAGNAAKPGNARKADNSVIPACIFTSPEIAVIGLNEEQARQNGSAVKINKIDFLASGMARIQAQTEGFIKIISDQKTGKILGAHIIGPKATELISVFSLAMSSGLGVKALKETVFAHPTLSEAIVEALD
jgi:dihydrolipoamide dehydrogenase